MKCHYIPRKLAVGLRYHRKRIVGTIFFSETVTAEKYHEIITQFILLLNEERFCWLQQDRIISKNLWPPQSPDLTPPDYFLWGYLKQAAYSNRPQSIEDLKQNIFKLPYRILPKKL
jgi:hypothetical protein